jgi:hypothetical protein
MRTNAKCENERQVFLPSSFSSWRLSRDALSDVIRKWGHINNHQRKKPSFKTLLKVGIYSGLDEQ